VFVFMPLQEKKKIVWPLHVIVDIGVKNPC